MVEPKIKINTLKNSILFIFILLSQSVSSQSTLKPLSELIHQNDSAWPLVQEWVKSAKNKVELFPLDSFSDKDALYHTQVTTRSPMGTIIHYTGGILVDDGWIRILGSGNTTFNRSITQWNLGKSITKYGQGFPYLLIADDAIGGFFLLNGGGLGSDLGKIYYLAPDTLEYEPLDIGYSEFLDFCFNSNLDDFYGDLRWKNWKKDISFLSPQQIIQFYPFLWTKDGKQIQNLSRNMISIEEHYSFTTDMMKQLEKK